MMFITDDDTASEIGKALHEEVLEWQREGGVNQGLMATPCQVPVGDSICGLPYQQEDGELYDHGGHLYSATPFRSKELVPGMYEITPEMREMYTEITARVEAKRDELVREANQRADSLEVANVMLQRELHALIRLGNQRKPSLWRRIVGWFR